jgi:uncharacterized protein YlaI
MPYRNWAERPGERRCINCDQRLVADGPPAPASPKPAQEPTVQYVCPDNHERWAYNAQSREWRQMY